MPQHLAQIWLLDQTLAGHRPDLIVTPWYYPNTLVYWLLYGIWKVADPISAGRLILSGLAAAWCGAAYLLCKRFERPWINWLIGVPFVFNFMFSWGFLNFLVGWPVFCVLLVLTRKPPSRSRDFQLFVVAFLLYYAHALWFAMANIWLAIQALKDRGRNRWRWAWPLVPAWVCALVWYPQLAMNRKASGVVTGMDWLVPPYERFAATYLTDSMLGSIHADIESAFCVAVGLWLLAAIATNWRALKERTDVSLLKVAALMLLAFCILPSMYMNTIFFNQRWLPFGMVMLLLALPSPRLPRIPLATLACGFLLVFVIVTVKQWQEWQDEALDGFLHALSLIEPNERVIGLNLYDGSRFVKGRPGLQLYAYAQVLRGAEPHFSFTEHYSGIVQFRHKPPPNPNAGWSSFMRTPAQVRAFDKVLVGGDEALQQFARKRWNLVQVNGDKTVWRVYTNAPAQTGAQ